MKLQADTHGGQFFITGHGGGWLAINGQRYQRSLLLLPDRIDTDWGPSRIEDLTAEHLANLAALAGHVVLLGTGARQHFPPAAILRPLLAAQIGVEIMTTSAACRTYNVLVADDRAVAAALIIE
jgi:uncharacterized protein